MSNTKQYNNDCKSKTPPDDYPVITLGSNARKSELSRLLMWEHSIPYGPKWDEWLLGEDLFPKYPELPSGPKSTLWDGWMCGPELWAAVKTDDIHQRMKRLWKEALLSRDVGIDGYVETRTGMNYAHKRGWAFPIWSSGDGGFGWHFTFHNQPGEFDTHNGKAYRPKGLSSNDNFNIVGLTSIGIDKYGWHLQIDEPMVMIETPDCVMDTFQVPFIQIRWQGDNLPINEPFIEWQCEGENEYSQSKRMYFSPCPERDQLVTRDDTLQHSYIMMAMYKHPAWIGKVKKIRIQLGNKTVSGEICLIGFFSNYDTRHNINNLQYIKGCNDYFNNTRDLDFLRRNIARMRRAFRGFMYDHHTLTEGVVLTTWVGHNGKGAIICDKDGNFVKACGEGIPNNWLDILPYGHYDCYCTAYYYSAVLHMAQIERMISNNPQWNIEDKFEALDADFLLAHSKEVKRKANEMFFNDKTGRFIACIDEDGVSHDYGFVLSNLEVLYAGLADEDHAKLVMDWISGRRIVEGDTSQGDDIYKYVFAPRITTLKNDDYWFWGWEWFKAIPFGGQIQDGGATLAFSYFDIMARIKAYGPDDAWKRMSQILDWYSDVCDEGGYKNYYEKHNLTLQGANVAGGLGITSEFFESFLPVQSILYGFLGYQPNAQNIVINPEIPSELETISITNIAWCDIEMDIYVSAKTKTITVNYRGIHDCVFEVKTDNEDYIIILSKSNK